MGGAGSGCSTRMASRGRGRGSRRWVGVVRVGGEKKERMRKGRREMGWAVRRMFDVLVVCDGWIGRLRVLCFRAECVWRRWAPSRYLIVPPINPPVLCVQVQMQVL